MLPVDTLLPYGQPTLPDGRAAAVVGHDFRNREQYQTKIGDTSLARSVRSRNTASAPVTA